jgi:hypothetical protein
VWVWSTMKTDADFRGSLSKAYSFVSVGHDHTGNARVMRKEPVTSTLVSNVVSAKLPLTADFRAANIVPISPGRQGFRCGEETVPRATFSSAKRTGRPRSAAGLFASTALPARGLSRGPLALE